MVTGGLNNPVTVKPAVPPRFVTDALEAEVAEEVAAELVDVVEGGMTPRVELFLSLRNWWFDGVVAVG